MCIDRWLGWGKPGPLDAAEDVYNMPVNIPTLANTTFDKGV